MQSTKYGFVASVIIFFKSCCKDLKINKISFHISSTLLKYFKGFCSSPKIIMLFDYMKCRFFLSYRDMEEMARIRCAVIDHDTLQRWVLRFVTLIDQEVRKRKKPVDNSWRMDETYLKVNGK